MSFAKDLKEELLGFTYDSETVSIIEGKQRSKLREAFLAHGSVSDPNKSYHLEFVFSDEDEAADIVETLSGFDIEARTTVRGKNTVVYIKEGEQIEKLLGLMGATAAFFDFENARILKEMRGSVNRKVNCETANIKKTVKSAQRQIAHIRALEESGSLEMLPENLREMARVRLEHPDASLAELGTYLNPQVGKSGVNHRMRKLMEVNA